MPVQVANNVRLRRNFGRIKKIIDLPYLIEIQKKSYDLFLQRDVPEDQRKDTGLQAVFKSVFPIKDFNDTASLEYVSYSLGDPKYDVDECHERGMNFAAPLKVTVQLVLWDVDAQTGSRSIRNVKEQEVYFGEVPLMTRNGTFMINGTERVIVSQLHRSPGVFFEHDKGKTHASGKFLYSARVIPYRGLVARFRVRSEGRPVRSHRPPAEIPRHRSVACLGDAARGVAEPLLQERYDSVRWRTAHARGKASPAHGHEGHVRRQGSGKQQSHRPGRPPLHPLGDAPDGERRHQADPHCLGGHPGSGGSP